MPGCEGRLPSEVPRRPQSAKRRRDVSVRPSQGATAQLLGLVPELPKDRLSHVTYDSVVRPQSARAETPARAVLSHQSPNPPPCRRSARGLETTSPKKNLNARFSKVHSPDCLVWQDSPQDSLRHAQTSDEARKATRGAVQLPPASPHLQSPGQVSAARQRPISALRPAAEESCCVSRPAPANLLEADGSGALKQQLQRARAEYFAAQKTAERLAREAAGWRQKFAALSERDKAAALELHLLTGKLAERDEALRHSLPHKHLLLEQTAQMRADFARENAALKDHAAAASAEAEARYAAYERRIEELTEQQMREEQTLRAAVRIAQEEASDLRMQLHVS
jgi:hypothetical protein